MCPVSSLYFSLILPSHTHTPPPPPFAAVDSLALADRLWLCRNDDCDDEGHPSHQGSGPSQGCNSDNIVGTSSNTVSSSTADGGSGFRGNINNQGVACRLICTAVGLTCRLVPSVGEGGLTKAGDGSGSSVGGGGNGGGGERITVVLKASSKESATPFPITPSATSRVTITTTRGKGERGEGGKGGEGGGVADTAFDRRAALIAVDAPMPGTKTRASRTGNEKSKTVVDFSPKDVAWDDDEEVGGHGNGGGNGDAKMESIISPVAAGQGLGQGLALATGQGPSDAIDKKTPTASHTRASSEASAGQAVMLAKRLIESATADKWFGDIGTSGGDGATGGGSGSSSNSENAW